MLLLILERKGEEKERERSIDVREEQQTLPPVHASNGDETSNPGMNPDLEVNPQPFGAPDNAPTNCTTWPGLRVSFY